MYVKLHSADLSELIIEQDFSRDYHQEGTAIFERETCIDSDYGKGTYREIFFEGIHIGHGDLRLKSTTLLQFETDFETVEMHFDLCGSSRATFDEPGSITYGFESNSHNIIYVPGTSGKMLFDKASSRVLEINIRPSVFQKYVLADGQSVFAIFMKHIEQQRHSLISRHNLPITPDMHYSIHEIIHCTKQGIYKRLFLEAKVIELLMLQIEQIAQQVCQVFCNLSKQDYDKIHYAREIILDRGNDPYSLADLARLVGTNEFTLKKGFRELFGTSVFGMVSDIKMERARKLLLDTDKNIAEISESIGYKNATHFTSAFKKKFGVTPRRYKNTDTPELDYAMTRQ